MYIQALNFLELLYFAFLNITFFIGRWSVKKSNSNTFAHLEMAISYISETTYKVQLYWLDPKRFFALCFIHF